MKHTLFSIFLFFSLTFLHAQSVFTKALWMSCEDPVLFEAPALFYDITGDEIRQVSYEDGDLYYTMDKNDFSEDGVSYQEEESAFNRNNAITYWINTCKECGWTETQVSNIFYIGTPYVYHLRHDRYVNNIGAGEQDGTFGPQGKSFASHYEGYLRLLPTNLWADEEFSVGGRSSDFIEIIEVRFTSLTTEIALRITAPNDEYGCTLNEPGSPDAFELQDGTGKSYALRGNFAWRGDGTDGFGSRILDEGEEVDFVLFFDPVPEGTQRLNMVEGECESGCWNFYDIRLKAKE